jgi:hypothetical protein
VGAQGLLISELPPGCRVLAGHFASRNRLLVALAAALVVVECPERSGALLSAELAWKPMRQRSRPWAATVSWCRELPPSSPPSTSSLRLAKVPSSPPAERFPRLQ